MQSRSEQLVTDKTVARAIVLMAFGLIGFCIVKGVTMLVRTTTTIKK